MGFLDHSTNNIILDAVLTDEGRRALAKNDNSFKIASFSLADDEVNYKIIKKYGRSVGKEKIEKNTPVFEGLTNQGLSQKSKLMSLSDPDIDYLPKLSLTSTNPLSLKRNVTTSAQVSVNQSFSTASGVTFDQIPEVIDSVFFVYLNDNFFTISGTTLPEYVDFQGISKYRLISNSSAVGALTFTINLRGLSDNIFSIYGDSSGTIKSFIRVVGISSGNFIDIPVTISKA
jgi:hypothetical protein